MGLFAPAGLPQAIRERLSAALVKSEKDPALQQRLRNAGIDLVGSDAASFEKLLDAENRKSKAFVGRTGVQLNP